MAEHFRDYLHPTIDPYAERVLDPPRNFTTRMLARYGEELFRMMGAEHSHTDASDIWRLHDGEKHQVAIAVHDPDRFFPALFRYRDIGLFYGYTGDDDGQLWSPSPEHTFLPDDIRTGYDEPDSLVQVVEAASVMSHIPRAIGRNAARLTAPLRDAKARRMWHESTTRTKDEIAAHYDISPEVYDAMLDTPHMQYSSGLLQPGQAFESLDQLQDQKIDSLIAMLDFDEAETLLEVGGGWGGLAVAIAERAPHMDITSLTVSHEQYTRAIQHADEHGVSDRVHFKELDYRDLAPEEIYDRVLSVEMIEAVDWRDHDTYFGALSSHAHPTLGKLALQAITIRPSQFASGRHNKSFANTAIFPGGVLTPKETINKELAARGWENTAAKELGASYAPTLREWIRNLWDHRTTLDQKWQADGIDTHRIERFWRGFSFYLAASEAGFRSGTGPNISDWQLGYSRKV